MMKRISIALTAVAVAGLPMFASAQEFATTTAVTTVTDLVTQLALVIAGVVASIIALYAALLGLGWGIRKVRHYISGRKF